MKKRRIVALGLLLVGAAVLLLVQRQQVSARITPRPVLYLIADTQRELERIPLQLTRVSEQEENQIGQELARSYGLTPAIHTNPDSRRMAEYVGQVGQRLLGGVERKGIQYRFFLKDDPRMVNAGALPGGQVVIGRGLLQLMQSEDELASVLGHEIAHVDKRHAIERLQYELKSKRLGVRGLYRLAHLGVVLYRAGYAKEQEEEADRVGLELMVKAGYSPGGALDIMRRFEVLRGASPRPADSAVEEILRIPGQSLGEYFRSHPPARERIAAFEKEIDARGWDASRPQKPMPIRSIFLAEHAEGLDKRGLFDRAIARYEEALRIDAKDARMWLKLARTRWRSGDAPGTLAAASECLGRDPDQAQAWELLARALAVEHPSDALSRFNELAKAKPPHDTHAASMVNAERMGLSPPGNAEALLKSLELSGGYQLNTRVSMLRRIAWWFHRAGKMKEAAGLLEKARQMNPQDGTLYRELAWVETDLGLQADAQLSLSLSREGGSDAQNAALEAVILWRIEKRKEAEEAFRRAAEADPVWMVEAWVQHNYSAESAAVLSKLRAAEAARRKLEDIRAGRTASASATKAAPPR